MLRMTGAYKTTATDALLVALGIYPIHLQIIRRAALYWTKKGNVEKATELLTINEINAVVNNTQDVNRIILETWQRSWDQSTTGRRTYGFFPCIRERLTLSHIKPRGGTLHYLTGHGPYRQTLHRLGIVDSPLCECRQEVGSPEHILWECERTSHLKPNERVILADRILFDIVRIDCLYTAFQEVANDVSKYYRDEYIRTLRERRIQQHNQLRS